MFDRAGWAGNWRAGGPLVQKPTASPLLAGLAVVRVAIDLPFFGGLANMVLTFLGMGALVIELYPMWNPPLARAELPDAQAPD